MSLSKPTEIIYELVGAYLQSLYSDPVKTKAITSCVIATFGNLVSQKLSGAKHLDRDSLAAFGLFGLLFGGPLPHYFYKYISSYTSNTLLILLIERLLYMPLFQALSLYTLSRFEGKSHQASVNQVKKLYRPVLTANLEYLTLLQFINIRFVPPMLRVLMVNLIGFFWTIFLAQRRARTSDARS